jgi:hypothetical protein
VDSLTNHEPGIFLQADTSRPLHAQATSNSNDYKDNVRENENASVNHTKIKTNQSPRGTESFTNELELRRSLYETSISLVTEGEKNISIALDLERSKDALRESKTENEKIRFVLLSGINGGISDTENHSNIPLTELLRIRLQEIEHVGMDSISFNHSFSWNKKQIKGNQEHSNGGTDSNRSQQKLADRRTPVQSTGCDNDIPCTDRLRKTIDKMNDRSRRDRETKQKVYKELVEANSKVDALSDHIEKLMVHLKHEAITKAKVLSERGKYTKEIEVLKKRNQILESKNARKDRAIGDLKEGGKLLEDQLSLMDEKYMELRMKLDWTRTQTEKIMKKKDEEVKDMRLQGLIADKNKAKVSKSNHAGVCLCELSDLVLLQPFSPKKPKHPSVELNAGSSITPMVKSSVIPPKV